MFKIRPNILFAIADDASHMGTDENFFLCTPAFDRIVKEGALFENAFASNPKCSPSRANILTGMHSWQLEDACIHSSDFSYKFRVFPELLEETDNLFDFVYVISHRFCIFYDTQKRAEEKHLLTSEEKSVPTAEPK